VKRRIRNLQFSGLCCAACLVLLAGLTNAAETAQRFEAGKKAKVTGMIQSRNGDLIKIKQKKTGVIAFINLTDNTKIERKKDFRLRRADMDVTAMVPGLTIDAEGIGNAKGQLDAAKIVFDPDTFAIEVAEEQQVEANQASAARAQSTANQGVAQAQQAQASAYQAQTSADQAGQTAQLAGTAAVMDAEAIQLVNKRVSDLANYQTVVEAALFFETGKSSLSDADKQTLSKLAQDAASVQNYMIEVAGYASSTGTKELNQKLSDERATAVTDYLRNTANVPMRRILVPAGYGASHPAVSNQDAAGRDVNQRVDVKVLVNKGIEEGS
jgi:outer membrane protein OmpA-like peptidoglycan-associated protein